MLSFETFTQAGMFVMSFGVGFFMAAGVIVGTVAGWRWVRRTSRASRPSRYIVKWSDPRGSIQ